MLFLVNIEYTYQNTSSKINYFNENTYAMLLIHRQIYLVI